jgi:hypothetical protein
LTQQELQNQLDKSFTIPVIIQTDTFANNIPYNQINTLNNSGFTFTAKELLHAIGSKTASLPANNQDESINAAYLYALILDFTGQNLGYKQSVNIDSDLQTNRSNEIGIGIGCLLANKQFSVNWDTLESIKGLGKRFDYRATNPGQNYVYEFKGTKYRGKQNEQITNGIEKKNEMHRRDEVYDVELIISTYLGYSNSQPRIILADPPFEGFANQFTNEAETVYLLRHLSRIAQFIGNPPLGRILYVQSREFDISKNINETQSLGQRLVSRDIGLIEDTVESKKLIILNFDNTEYIGRWVSYWRPQKKRTNQNFIIPPISDNQRFEVFQGVNIELYNLMLTSDIVNFNNKVRYERRNFSTETSFTAFSDGTIMGYRILDE